MLVRRRLEVLQVLLKRRFIELSEEVRLDTRVIATDVVDELTFGHGVFTFEKRVASGRVLPDSKRDPVCGRTRAAGAGVKSANFRRRLERKRTRVTCL